MGDLSDGTETGAYEFEVPEQWGVSKVEMPSYPNHKIAVWFESQAFSLTVADARELADAITKFCNDFST